MAFQDERFVSVKTPLGEDVLLFNRMSGYEEMGRLFEYNLELRADNKSLNTIKAEDILGQAMLVRLSLPHSERYYHGLVTQFRHLGTENDYFLYQATLRPWLWFLTRNSNCRIFQDKKVDDILKEVFAAHHFSDFKFELTRSYARREYCVQYRETDFNFVSRLMEHEGIFYFFTHEQDKHILVIADSLSAYQTVDGYDSIPYFPPENTKQRERDHIFEWHTAHKIQSGAYVLNDYDFQKPTSNLRALKKNKTYTECEQYDYPGNYCEASVGDNYATIRLDELQTDYEVIQGRGNALGLTTGMLFTLTDHYLSSENTKHILISANFFITNNQYRSSSSEEASYECHFKAIRDTQPFRPQRLTPVPFVQGPQTATVVGEKGSEIWTDKYGRIKVQFHWERDGKKNETSSCWIRVAYPVAGKQWGWVSLPRIGQEVVVSFLEGNPDRPLITGSVYNANQMPPYTLPDNKTQSGIKSRSSKEGTPDNFNEFRFEDKKGHEQVYLHAEKSYDIVVESSESHSVGANRSKTIGHDETTHVKNNRTETVDKNESVTIGENKNVLIGKNESVTIAEDQTIAVGKNIKIYAGESIILIVGGSSIEITPSNITLKSSKIDLNP